MRFQEELIVRSMPSDRGKLLDIYNQLKTGTIFSSLPLGSKTPNAIFFTGQINFYNFDSQAKAYYYRVSNDERRRILRMLKERVADLSD
jgi:hypothetical protein